MEDNTAMANTGMYALETSSRGRRGYWLAKRTLDILLSALALAALSPVMLIVAVAITLDDPRGGPIFRQRRVGRHGREFTFYKFRSMCVGAEKMLGALLEKNEMDGPVFKMKRDPRITRVGSFLRKTSLDELPQFVNVLLGDMSIVGPRPPLPREVAMYSARERLRLSVTPGLTCLWQVKPERNSLSFDEWVRLDLRYVRERSHSLDFKLILLTAKAMLLRHGI